MKIKIKQPFLEKFNTLSCTNMRLNVPIMENDGLFSLLAYSFFPFDSM